MPEIGHYQGQLAADLSDYRTKGEREAAQHRPPADAVRIDQHESSLLSRAEKHIADEQHLFDAAVTESSRVAVEIRQKAVELESKVSQLLSDTSLQGAIEADMSADRRALVAATESRMRAEVDYRAFRAANGITEEAQYPESHIWHFAVIAVLALVETIINAFFYENTQGLLGGFTIALGVAAINMVGAMILGMGFRYKNLASVDKKALGWSCLIMFFVLAIYCNALFSTFRAEYQLLTDPSDNQQLRHAFALSAAEAKKIFLLDMQFGDLMSFILFGIGILLSMLAFYKGYTFDDRYPGHGKKDRAVKVAYAQEIELQELLRQKVKDLLHRRRGEIQAASHEPTQLISRLNSRVSDLLNSKALLEMHTQAVERDCMLVLRTYREANTSIRATAPPSYFSEFPDLSSRVSSASSDSVVNSLKEVQGVVTELRIKHQDSLNEKLRELQGDAAVILNKTFTQFLLEIEEEAKAKIDRLVQTMHRKIGG